jgi:hypothetical protein
VRGEDGADRFPPSQSDESSAHDNGWEDEWDGGQRHSQSPAAEFEGGHCPGQWGRKQEGEDGRHRGLPDREPSDPEQPGLEPAGRKTQFGQTQAEDANDRGEEVSDEDLGTATATVPI